MKTDKKNKAKEVEQPPLFDLTEFTLEEVDSETMKEKFSHKIDDVTFWGVMVAAMGIPNRAVKVFARDYEIKISRQAVNFRANKHPERLKECRELILDAAEEVGLNLLLNGDKRTQAEIYKHITSKLGAGRGYSGQLDVKHSGEIKNVVVEHVTTGIPFASNEKDIQE